MNIRSTNIHELADLCQRWVKTEMRSQSVDEIVRQLDQFAQEFDDLSHEFASCAAWCRLAIGDVRGEDVPESIYRDENEDPGDTARWQQWRVNYGSD